MIRPAPLASAVLLALLSTACASGGSSPTTQAPDRIILTSTDGRQGVGPILRQQTDAAARVSFQGTTEQVWAAVVGSYIDLGIEPNTSDKSAWRFGVVRYMVPRRLKGASVGSLFACGSGMTGPLVDQGRVMADVITTLTPGTDGTTSASIYVDGVLQKSEGTSSDPLHCSSTGKLEEMLRVSVNRKLGTS